MTAQVMEVTAQFVPSPDKEPLPYPTADIPSATLADPIPPPYSSAWPRWYTKEPEHNPDNEKFRQVILASLDGPGLLVTMSYTQRGDISWLINEPIVGLMAEDDTKEDRYLMLGPESAEILIREIASLLGFQVVRR